MVGSLSNVWPRKGRKIHHQPWPALPVSSSVGSRASLRASARPAPGPRTSWRCTSSSRGPGRRWTWPLSRCSAACAAASVFRGTRGSWPGGFPTTRPATTRPCARCSVRSWRPGSGSSRSSRRRRRWRCWPQAARGTPATAPSPGSRSTCTAPPSRSSTTASCSSRARSSGRTASASMTGKAQLLQRYSLVAQLAPEVRRGIAAVRAGRGIVGGGGRHVRRSPGAPLAHDAAHRGARSRGRDARFDRRASRGQEGEGRALRRVGAGDPSGLRGRARALETAAIRDPLGGRRRGRHRRHRRAGLGELRVLARIDWGRGHSAAGAARPAPSAAPSRAGAAPPGAPPRKRAGTPLVVAQAPPTPGEPPAPGHAGPTPRQPRSPSAGGHPHIAQPAARSGTSRRCRSVSCACCRPARLCAEATVIPAAKVEPNRPRCPREARAEPDRDPSAEGRAGADDGHTAEGRASAIASPGARVRNAATPVATPPCRRSSPSRSHASSDRRPEFERTPAETQRRRPPPAGPEAA